MWFEWPMRKLSIHLSVLFFLSFDHGVFPLYVLSVLGYWYLLCLHSMYNDFIFATVVPIHASYFLKSLHIFIYPDILFCVDMSLSCLVSWSCHMYSFIQKIKSTFHSLWKSSICTLYIIIYLYNLGSQNLEFEHRTHNINKAFYFYFVPTQIPSHPFSYYNRFLWCFVWNSFSM